MSEVRAGSSRFESATDELRRLLDERGVEWWAGEDECDRKTHWESSSLTWEYYNDENGDAWLGFLGACESDVSPEQAVSATLGRWTCRDVGRYAFVCSVCGWASDEPHHVLGGFWPKYCPECGRAVVNDQ